LPKSEVLVVIPARGGSKGLPRKNVLPLAGKPLIAHAIGAALSASTVTRVVVSTDDPEIAAVSRAWGAEVVDRPAELAGDTASSEAALAHTLEVLATTQGYRPDVLVFMQCTSPLTSPADVDATATAVLEGADTAVAVTPFHYFLWRPDGTGVNHDKSVRLMRQQREPEYLETGAVYAMRVDGFLEARHRFFGRTVLVDTPIERRLEIDDLADFQLAEERMGRLRRTAEAALLPDPLHAVIMDFDGVWTDDRVFVDQNGVESVVCSRRDGMGLERLVRSGMPMMVLSKETNPVVRARTAKLKIPCEHGLETKLDRMQAWLDERGLLLEQTIYVGNDINDIECLRAAGCGIAPRDSHPEALAVADLVLDADGGRGALRLLSDMILSRPGGGRG
jgi:YrbI family 3-deoxy-D-manno-octulosonate 8-phosphate phosphatase